MKHIALNYDFDSLLEGLETEVRKGYINRNDKKELTLYNYKECCHYDKAWNDFTIAARGLILHIPSGKIVALPFPKFFNYGEMSREIPELPFSIAEKLDGSLGVLYFWCEEWHVNTRGSFDSLQGKWAKKWIGNNINTNELNTNHTYLVEIIIKENRIVINYDYEGLVLLSAFKLTNGEELDKKELDKIAISSGLKRPEFFDYTFNELLDVVKTLKANQEGFVLKFSNGLYLKIKGEEYCRVHRSISEVTPLGVWRALMNLDDLEKIRKKLPEEYRVDFNNLVKIINNNINVYFEEIKRDYEKTKDLTDKELGLRLKEFTGISGKFLFDMRKIDFLNRVKVQGGIRDKFFRIFRPTGNVLDGYVPTGALNRFNDEG